ncbi:hypothetical protein JW916_11265 [Candidatus Sumerlaeota bacterium]|nr:hypothetical protein [Candidatus Sumerlaeota bacterium]
MTHLQYKENYDEARDLLTKWWAGEDIGRPAMQLTAKRATPIEDVPVMPKPEGWLTGDSISNYEYRLYLAARQCVRTHWLGETMPRVSPQVGPGALALYLGCRAVDQARTVWIEECIPPDDPESTRFEVDPQNPYWDFTLRFTKDLLRLADGKFILSFPDLIEGLDTLASMRGTEALLFDMMERPEWVHQSLARITERYFECYDAVYDLIKDERGGSHFWLWAPGRLAKLQCDISAMISPDMFKEFMVPVLEAMCERLDCVLYHWDGPGAIPHHDHILAVEGIDVVQWQPGSNAARAWDPQWWPMYHKTVDAGKKLFIDCNDLDSLKAMRKEFGAKLKQFMLIVNLPSPDDAPRFLDAASV